MNTAQVQLKVSLSQQLSDLLKSKAQRLGVPVTQFVKHLIIKELEEEEYPTFEASEETIQAAKKAIKERHKAIKVTNIHEYFKSL